MGNYTLDDMNYSFVALRHNVGPGFLMLEVYRSHNDAPHSVGLLWMSDQSVAETSN